ncbi:MobA/MobL family protein [Waterburya agarophytonicola K14]|uniref:MobA/MobL family protein n=1 Tax=Waterburya agarophytonicola KI4 TaxID=2874699 RepID=A0A964BTT1_9CYAN|nr:MobA/MobL family protein [Waterburya agarophytonicola]MCC0178037.1 MobA/MobL family protein [Waterburya agarophytonicola KI4]
MAVPHLCVKYGSRQTGSSAKDHFKYICRLQANAKDDLVFVSHQNYPAWGNNPIDFYQAADLYERANARLYREIVVALPRELSQESQLKLITKWAESELGKSHPYTIAVHSPLALDGKPNAHAHIMFSDRTLDGVEREPKQFFKRANRKNPELGGAAKDVDWKRKQKVVELRQSWEKAHNLALEQAGISKEAAISMKSLKDQGIDRVPEPKLGVRQSAMLRQGRENNNTRLVKALREVRNMEASLGGIQKEIDSTIRDLAKTVVRDSSLFIPANEIKSEVRSRKLDLYEKLREIESQRYKLGLLHTADGGVYQKSSDQKVNQKRAEVEKRFSTLNQQLATTKKFEKNLRLLGEIPIAIKKGKPLADEKSLCDRPGFLQKVKEAKQQLKRLELSNQIQLQRDPPPSAPFT